MKFRNVAFEMKWITIYIPKVKTIAVGNLNTGGTGKTPFVEFLIRSFKEKYKIAVVSRGYGRKTTGFRWVDADTSANESGDEALQIKRKFEEVTVAVCEKRSEAIQKIEDERKEIDLIILDDAFQHRSVKASIYILLTTFKKPFYTDFILPAGNLRESRSGVKRADFIVMTKCPSTLSKFDCNAIQKIINPKAYQKVHFSQESYGKIYPLFDDFTTENWEAALVVTGIADNKKMSDHLMGQFEHISFLNLKDHVKYDTQVISKISDRFNDLHSRFETCIITTEKDAVKLKEFKKELGAWPVFVLPVSHKIVEEQDFLDQLGDKILH